MEILLFKYHNLHRNSEAANYVGKIKEIGTVKINYNEDYSANVNKGFVGKIKNIGNVNFNYFKNTYNNNASGITGKFQSITGTDNRFIIY